MRRLAVLYLLTLFMLVFVRPAVAQDAETDAAWTAGEPMPTPRSEIASAVVDGMIYVAGGLAPREGAVGWDALDTFEVYDMAADTWTELEPLPVPLHHLAMAANDGLIYMSGGYDGGNFRADVAALWVYDPETAVWSELAPMPAPRAAHAMATLDGRLYVMGGFVEPEERAPELWVYDIATDRWAAGFAPMPTLREHLAAVALDGLIYVIGGRWGIDNLADLEAYDPETDAWTALAPMPSPRGGLAAAVVGGRIHVFGGEPVTTLNAYATYEAYDPAIDEWVTLPDMPTPRHGLTAQGVDGALVVIGGGKEAGSRTFYSLTGVVEIYRPEPDDA